jgi:hypothetical protein
MLKARVIFWSMVTVVAIGATATSASAAITFQWKVGGKILKAGERRTFTARRDGVAILKGSVAGAAAELSSNKGKVKPGALIFGGQPGTSDETLELESVIVDKPAGCEVESPGAPTGVVRTTQLTSEIVEAAPGGTGNGEPLILLRPASSTNETWVELTFLGASCIIKGTTALITGLKLGLPLPQEKEVVVGVGDEEAVTKEYKLSTGGSAKKAGLTFAGNIATVTGLVLVELASKEAGGVF